jgi:hypothetical protein
MSNSHLVFKVARRGVNHFTTTAYNVTSNSNPIKGITKGKTAS